MDRTAADQILQQRPSHTRVLRRSLPQAQNALDPVGADAQRDHQAMLLEHLPADHHDPYLRSIGRARNSASRCFVSTTKQRETEDREVERRGTAAAKVSSERQYFRVDTPAAIASSVRVSSGSRSAAQVKLGSTSRAARSERAAEASESDVVLAIRFWPLVLIGLGGYMGYSWAGILLPLPSQSEKPAESRTMLESLLGRAAELHADTQARASKTFGRDIPVRVDPGPHAKVKSAILIVADITNKALKANGRSIPLPTDEVQPDFSFALAFNFMVLQALVAAIHEEIDLRSELGELIVLSTDLLLQMRPIDELKTRHGDAMNICKQF